MRVFSIFFAAIFFLGSSSFAAEKKAPAKPLEPILISMVGSNAIDSELPFGVFNGKGFHAAPKSRFVKIHIFPDRATAVPVNRVSVELCAPGVKRIEGFINFDEKRASSEGDKEEAPLSLSGGVHDSKALMFSGSEVLLESLTLNFGNASGVCIKSIKLITPDDQEIPVIVPKVVEGSVNASSVLEPKDAYAPENLFDSRFENSWASNKEMTGSKLGFTFKDAQHIEKIKIWNGYQRSVTHCQDNSRAKKIEVTGDNGYKAELTVADKLGSQVLDLPKPFEGKNLTIRTLDVFKGRVYKDMVISELRFFDGKEWSLINPLAYIHELNRKNTEQFTRGGLEAFLGSEFTSRNQEDYDENDGWTFRLRSDGTAYIQGYVYSSETPMAHSALGNYEIKSVKDGEIKLRVFGFLNKGELAMDCNGCGHACNSPDKQKDIGQKIFQEFITLRRTSKKGEKLTVMAINENKKPKLSFKSIKLTESKTL
jgi:hypothetical protein